MSDSVKQSRSRNGSRPSSKKGGTPTPVAAVMPRSVSLSTLPSLSVEALKPRISRLETLEAKMANIEVSLSNGEQVQQQAPPRKQRMSLQNRTTPNNSNNKQEVSQLQLQDINLANDNISKLMKEIESIRQEIKDKDEVIENLRKQNNLRKANGDKDSEVKDEMQIKQEKLKSIQQEIDDKQAVIKTIRFAMENLEVNDSLDERIHQAELEFQQEREELALLNLQQDYLAVKNAIEEQLNEKNKPIKARMGSFFSLLGVNRCATLVAVEVPYNPQSPNFVIAAHQNGHGLFVQWARDNSCLKKGDRLIEVNGHLLLNGTRDDLVNVLSKTSITIALQIMVLRNVVQPPQRWVNAYELHNLKDEIATVVNKLETKTKENKNLYGVIDKLKAENGRFQRDNLKLNHRIMFLEDQVGDLQRSWEDLRCTLNQVDLNGSLGSICSADGRKSKRTSKQVIKIHNNDNFHSLPYHSSNSSGIQKSKSTEAVSSKLNFHKLNHHSGTTSITVNQNNTTTTVLADCSDPGNPSRNRSIVKSSSMSSYIPLKEACQPKTNQRENRFQINEMPNNSVNIFINREDGNPTKSKSMSSVPTYLKFDDDDEDDEDFDEVTPELSDKNGSLSNNESYRTTEATNVHVGTSSIVKSQSFGHLDHVASVTEASNHILQVHVPFTQPSDSEATRGGTPLKRSVSVSRLFGNQQNPPRPQLSPDKHVDSSQTVNGFRLHQYQQFQNQSESNIRPSQIAFHLKVNNNKIALDDFESDHEQWC